MLWRPTKAVDDAERWWGIELDGSRVSGDDNQDLAAGERLELDNTSFFGPGRVASDYELTQTTLAAVFGRDVQHELSLSVLAGVGFQELELELSSAALRAQDRSSWGGVFLGAEFQWTPPERVWGLGARVTCTGNLKGDFEQLQRIEAGLSLRPSAALGVFVGWGWSAYDALPDVGSDIELRTNGPALGLRVDL
ncbi:MAG: hypothetical protein EXS08_07095 [Planctomycetes bacterium]|nr:hypothetical protein [Planctomycetota bacterium]